MKKQQETIRKNQDVDVYLHFLSPGRTVSLLERIRLIAIGCVAGNVVAIGLIKFVVLHTLHGR